MSIESRPLNHGNVRPRFAPLRPRCGWPVMPCADCALEARLVEQWPEIGPWEVIGEGVVRGQWFRDLWLYVLANDFSRNLVVTAEALADNEQGFHEAALCELAAR